MTEEVSDFYHEGEIAVQRRAGVRDQAEMIVQMAEMPDPTGRNLRNLIEDQPHAVVTSVDRDGDVWVSFLTGPSGFISVEDSETIRFGSDPVDGDPLGEHLRPEMPTGVLLVDPRTRHRVRVHGFAAPLEEGFDLEIEEIFPNCQKYIQQRSFVRAEESAASERTTGKGLEAAHREWIRNADTFFLGSYYPETGADASHRGGDPGFVEVEGDTVRYPDYPGNNMFCTLGNIEADSRVGLLFVDFTDGRTLQLTGHAEIVWDEDRVAQYDGAERLVEITVDRAVELSDGNPLRWSLEQRSPFNP